MKRVYLLVVMLMMSSALIRAQENQPAQSFTLEQCIQYALENSNTVKNAVIDQKIADAKVRETTGIGLPQISGNVTLQHNQKLPRFFATKQTAFGFSGLPPEEYSNFLPGVEDNAVVASRNFFQLPSSGNAGLTINQLLFSSSYLVGLKAANTYRELSKRTADQSREQSVEQVTKAYYGVIINKDRLQLFASNIARVESLLKTTKAMNENGFAEDIDVDRIQVSLNNLKTERDKVVNLQELSLQLLKFQMNYPMQNPIDVVGEIASLKVNEEVLSEYTANWDYKERIDYQILETNKKLQELDIKNKFSEGLPSLSAFANLGYATQSPNIGGLFKTETNITDNGSLGPDKWYPATSFGVSLNVPLFGGMQQKYRIQQAKLSLQKIDNNFIVLQSTIDLEVKRSATTYLNAIKSLETQRENQLLAEKVARVTRIKYEQGVGSNTEVIDAESSLKESQTNYYNALYDALVAKVDLDKAFGKLNIQTTESK